MPDAEMGQVTQMLVAIHQGDEAAKRKLFELVYNELRWIASNRLGGQQDAHTLGVTGLVHEAFLRFLRGTFPTEGREHFFRTINQAMRQILIDHYRRKQAREGHFQRIPLDDLLDTVGEQEARTADLDHCLSKLKSSDQRSYEVVFRFYFMGEHVKDMADQLQLSVSAIEKDLRFARAFLRKCLGESPE
jgi:RNA polymerase sigma factor (TIGR02999 family)